MNDKYELAKFKDDEFELDINVSPDEETVWLTKDDIALLFDRDRTVISKHIRNIFNENELDLKQVCAKNARTGSDGKTYIVDYYNLDVVISVGYRVKSKRGIIFRKWANSVLKQYLLKGYVLDSDRVIISKNNYIQLENDVKNLKTEVKTIKEKMFLAPTKERLFYNGDFYDAYEFMISLIGKAEKELLIINPYFDNDALKLLTKTKPGIKITIINSNKSKLNEYDIEAFSKQYNIVKVVVNNIFHDRVIIIDKNETFLVGTSLNHIGKRVFMISKLEDVHIRDSILKTLANIV